MPAYDPTDLHDPSEPIYTITVWKPHATLGYWSANLVSDSGDTDIGATGPSPHEAVEAVFATMRQMA